MTEKQNANQVYWDLVALKNRDLGQMFASGELTKLQGAEHGGAFAWLKTNPVQSWDSTMHGNVVTGPVNFNIAARKLVTGSHVLATESEIIEFQTRTRREYNRLAAEEAARGGRQTVVIEALAPQMTVKK